jgi:NADH-quinone oxidoreductase subunit J
LVAFLGSGLMAGLLARRFSGAGEFFDELEGARAIDAALVEKGALGVIAEPLYTTYVVPFEITGILLLVAIVGALVLAKRRVT